MLAMGRRTDREVPPLEYLIAAGGLFSTLAAGFWAWLTQRQTIAERLQNTTFSQAEETIKRQGDQILRLEGRLDQVASQVTHLLSENAGLSASKVQLEAQLKLALEELAVAKRTIAALEVTVTELRRRLGENA